MGTRSGDLDPGLMSYLALTESMDTVQFQTMVNHQSGMLGISESSADVRDLLARESSDPRAAEALALFCYQAKKWIGSFAAALGGVDTLVFAGGIGENAAPVRKRICDGLNFLGIEIDENANGRRDVGEPALANVRVLVGSVGTHTDTAGSYRVWDLVPFEPIFVTIDSLSLESPLLVPAFSRASIVPGPNRFRTLDIPVVQAGVIEGRVTRDGRGAAGVTLILTDKRSGTRRTLVTFTDGGFYLLGVKPGDYVLTVDERVLDALGADAAPLSFQLAPTPDGVGRSDLELRLKPRF